jgi:hypothetical protein
LTDVSVHRRSTSPSRRATAAWSSAILTFDGDRILGAEVYFGWNT